MNDFVSIITVNYNGKKILPMFLSGVSAINYQKNRFELIVVDNGSTDGSDKMIEENYKWVRLIKSKKNLGFGGGNNFGIESAKGDLLFLVNNDTVLDPDCLLKLTECFKRWGKGHKVGAVSAKLLLIDKYIPVNLQNAYLHDYSFDNVKNYGINKVPYIIREYLGENYQERAYIPLNYGQNGNLKLKLIVKNPGDVEGKVRLGKGEFKGIDYSDGDDFRHLDFELSNKQVDDYSIDLIQNAGSYIFRDGYGRDRGAIIIGGKQFYEEDKGQYNEEEKLSAFCGAGVMINKKAIKEIGKFDESFFMYYEDDDLSFRIREGGWDIIYCPKAKIRHIHAASSGEWSPKFVYNVERSRLLFVSKHWPKPLVIWEWLKYFFKDTIAVPIGHLFFMEYREFLGKLRLRLMVNMSIIPFIIKSLFERSRLTYADVKKLY